MSQFTESEKKEKIIEYSKRHQFWLSQSVTQFGFSINLFLTLGLAFISLLFNKIENYDNTTILTCYFDYKLLGYFIALFFILVSISAGLICVLTRLWDLRITRHIILVRKRTAKKLSKPLSDKFISQSCQYLPFLKELITKKIEFVKEEDFEDFKKLSSKFKGLRTCSRNLGELSWKTHKFQLYSLIISLIIYGISSIFLKG